MDQDDTVSIRVSRKSRDRMERTKRRRRLKNMDEVVKHLYSQTLIPDDEGEEVAGR